MVMYMSLFYPHCSYGLCNTLLDVYFIDFCNKRTMTYVCVYVCMYVCKKSIDVEYSLYWQPLEEVASEKDVGVVFSNNLRLGSNVRKLTVR